MPTLRNYVRAFGGSWFAAMSGPLAVPFTIAAVYVEGSWQKAGFALLAIICAVYASFSIWKVERVARTRAEAQLAARETEKAAPAQPVHQGITGIIIDPGAKGFIDDVSIVGFDRAITVGTGGEINAKRSPLTGPIGPEVACPCGSGKKFKNCHGRMVND